MNSACGFFYVNDESCWMRAQSWTHSTSIITRCDKPEFVSSFSGMIFWLSGLARTFPIATNLNMWMNPLSIVTASQNGPCNGSAQIQIQIQARWLGVVRLTLFNFKYVAI
jgi:hypothetical protein